MSSRLGYNIHAQQLHGHGPLLRHLRVLKPAATLVMDNLPLARAIQRELPGSTVIHRRYMNDGIHKQLSPSTWLGLHHEDIEAGVWLYCNNEPEWSDEAMDWLARMIPLAVERRAKLVLGNWAVGFPVDPDDWQRARKLLELLDLHRETMILGLHEYGCGVLTSGLVGGAPDETEHHPNYIRPENWPLDARNLTLWHCGRFKFLNAYCNGVGIKPPRIIITEHGLDDLGDLKDWSNQLARTEPYTDINGWRTLERQWAKWWPNWSAEEAYYQQLDWADRAIYQKTNVEAQLIYCYQHVDPRWGPFDVAGAGQLQTLLETRSQRIETAQNKIISTDVPAEKGESVAITVKIPPPTGMTDLFRRAEEPRGIALGTVFSGESILIYPETKQEHGKVDWYYVERQRANLPDMQRRGWIAYEIPVPAPETPPVPDKPNLTVLPPDVAGKIQELHEKQAKLLGDLAEINRQLAQEWKVIRETA